MLVSYRCHFVYVSIDFGQKSFEPKERALSNSIRTGRMHRVEDKYNPEFFARRHYSNRYTIRATPMRKVFGIFSPVLLVSQRLSNQTQRKSRVCALVCVYVEIPMHGGK